MNDFILIIIGFGNKPDFINKKSYMSTFIYVDISAFFVFNSIIIYLIINIFKQVKHKKIYFRGIRSKLIQLSTFNLLFLPLYQIGIFLNSLNFIIYSYTTGCFFLTFTLKSLLRKSNSIITSINDGNYIEDTILPYDPISGDISDDPSGDISGDPSGDISGDSSDDSSEINDIENDNETFLLPENHS